MSTLRQAAAIWEFGGLKPRKITLILALVLFTLSGSAPAAVFSYFSNGPFNNNGGAGAGIIPDASAMGLSDSCSFRDQPPAITLVSLSVTLQGGFGSDLSGYLRMGNEPNSPYADLTPTLQGQVLDQNFPTTFTVDLTDHFDASNPNVVWTLFFADSSAAGQTTLSSWNLYVTSEVPEPITWALIIFGTIFTTAGLFRRYGQKRLGWWFRVSK